MHRATYIAETFKADMNQASGCLSEASGAGATQRQVQADDEESAESEARKRTVSCCRASSRFMAGLTQKVPRRAR